MHIKSVLKVELIRGKCVGIINFNNNFNFKNKDIMGSTKEEIVIKKRSAIIVIMGLIFLSTIAGCGVENKSPLDAKTPVVVTLWHAYNPYVKGAFDQLVSEFNETVGLEQGIIVEAYGYGDQTELEDALYNSASKAIGSDPLPHMFTSYPSNAYRIDQVAPLVALNTYFSEEELKNYRQEFLAEGIWDEQGTVKTIPVAKSTELLYLNKTDWDKFSLATGCQLDLLATWEGLAQASALYYQYSGGKAMFGMNPLNNFMSITTAQMGGEPYEVNNGQVAFRYTLAQAKKVWDICYVPHLEGWYRSDNYCSDGIKSGNLIAYVGSSAGAGYFPQIVTISAEENYPIECIVLPYPTITGGQPYMSQRGANIAVTTTDDVHEYAASVFLKWFTHSEQNMPFAASTGYIPVENEALTAGEALVGMSSESENNQAVAKSVMATTAFSSERIFYSHKPFLHSYEADVLFEKALFDKISADIQSLDLRVANGESREQVLAELTGEAAFLAWYEELMMNVEQAVK